MHCPPRSRASDPRRRRPVRPLPATGDRELRNELVELHRHLAAAVARRYAERGEPVEDLEQAGVIGLLRAVERYQPGIAPFASFARATISGEIRRHFRDRTWSVHVPRPIKDLEQRLAPAIEALAQELGRPPRPAEVAQRLGVGVDAVLEAMQSRHGYRPASLEDRARTSGAARGAVASDHADEVGDRLLLERLLRDLAPDQRRIVELRFTDGLSQREIGRRLGVSQVQVGRVLRVALGRLRTQLTEPASDASCPR